MSEIEGSRRNSVDDSLIPFVDETQVSSAEERRRMANASSSDHERQLEAAEAGRRSPAVASVGEEGHSLEYLTQRLELWRALWRLQISQQRSRAMAGLNDSLRTSSSRSQEDGSVAGLPPVLSLESSRPVHLNKIEDCMSSPDGSGLYGLNEIQVNGEASEGSQGECRFCKEDDLVQNMDTPCACSGSILYVHRKCLQDWCYRKRDTTCGVCKQPYKGGYEATPRLAERLGEFISRHLCMCC